MEIEIKKSGELLIFTVKEFILVEKRILWVFKVRMIGLMVERFGVKIKDLQDKMSKSGPEDPPDTGGIPVYNPSYPGINIYIPPTGATGGSTGL